MDSSRFACPMCRSVLAIDSGAGANQLTRCPDCHTVFRLPEAAPAPRARRPAPPPSSGGSGALWVILVLGFLGVTLFVLVAGGVGIYFAVRGKGGGGGLTIGGTTILGNSLANKENFEKLEIAMTLPEVEAILGKGKRADMNDIKDAFAEQNGYSGFRDPPSVSWRNNAQSAGVQQWYRWQNGDFSIFVGFAKGRSGKERALLSFWVEKTVVPGGGRGFESEPGIVGSARFTDPDDIARDRDKENRQLNDPKWNKGDVRQMVVGTWDDGIGGGYTFGADGSVRSFGLVNFNTSYRFVSNDQIEMTIPPLVSGPGAAPTTVRYRVLVTLTELWLADPGRHGLTKKFKRGTAGRR